MIRVLLKSILTNKWDILATVFWPALFTVLGNFLVEIPGGWIFQNLLYTLAVLSVCVHAPWVFIAVTAPNTWGKFINDSWDERWARLLTYKNIDSQFKVVWLTYLVLVIVTGLLSAAIFLGTPAGG